MTSNSEVGLKRAKTSSAKGGRPSRAFRASDGTEIHGLYRVPNSNRWRIVETGERFRESDERRAIQKFRDWEAARHPSIAFPLGDAVNPETLAEDSYDLAAALGSEVGPDGKVQFTQKVKPEKLWPYFRDILVKDPAYAAKMTGLPAEIGAMMEL